METEVVTRLWLVRHGRVDDRWQGRVYGCLDVPLSELGVRHSRRAAALLAARPLELVASSGLERAEHGAELLRTPRGLARRDEPDLRELDRGEWAGLGLAELEARHPGAWDAWLEDPGARKPPGGESLADLAARALPRLAALVGEVCGGEIAVVTHAWVIRCAVARALDLPLRATPSLEVPPGGLVALDWPVMATSPDAATARVDASASVPFASERRPVLVGLNLDRAPDRATGWHRGPRYTVAPRPR